MFNFGLAAATAWIALSAAPKRSDTHEALRTQCLIWAADPHNPWALAHGIVGLGKSYLAKDGRLAADVMVDDFLERGNVPGGSPLGFARYLPDQTPVEPHTNLIAKTLVLAGFPMSRRFETRVGPVTLGELVASVKQGYRHVPSSEGYWREVAWTLDLLAQTLTPDHAVFEDGAHEKIDFNGVMDDALTYLEKADAEIARGMDQGLSTVPKDKQGIWAHHCGGMHLIQAVNHWARFPAVRKRWGARWERQIDVLLYRVGAETEQYEAALQRSPEYRLFLRAQQVKFYGHFLETVGRLKAETGWRPSVQQRQTIEKAKALLDEAVRGLEEIHAFEHMDQLRTSEYQTYLDLIGDSCHATHGWDYWQAG